MKRLQTLAISILATCGASLCFASDSEMIFIPAGEFQMGADDGYYDEAPAHRVSLSAYWIDKYEVNNRQFAAYVRERELYEQLEGAWHRHSVEGSLDMIRYFEAKAPETMGERCKRKALSARFALAEMLELPLAEVEGKSADQLASLPGISESLVEQANLPARGMSWRDARGYALAQGKRLPTEAEWERAARGLKALRYPWGDEWRPLAFSSVKPVDHETLSPSPSGCVGMAGNVWEWVEDWYGESYYSQETNFQDPTGPEGLANGELPGPYSPVALLRSGDQGREDDTRKVIRGGGFGGNESQARFNFRCSRRLWCNPNYWHADIGFRCVKDN
ncbi:SUMF1/EgtB/PvdO family nonheme iron enzyme [Pelagicoccus sp. SDUM812003]|uniref:formylglycine-generating enzyme family protein n=1 Tax=Pelagicoccus sp. SDUM812003 TaxID=3041267 RepID=UPI00280D09E1|nr:SUMF1/EgtB/PvdO family nonheme iron enzyme [Pelagicoccus sp. SDUM812003]MDQ8202093.1 SUMF1/EgtB/PvdO family nonheme iron enzyme [Pelagicoccus sp. SDUM812003]